ncbi:hypothetical protein ABPG72_006707 [Tetrahymena utriculariae]
MSAALNQSEFSRNTDIYYKSLLYLETSQAHENNSLYFFKQIIYEPEYFFNEEYFKKEAQQVENQIHTKQKILEQSYNQICQQQSEVQSESVCQSDDQIYIKDNMKYSQNSFLDIKPQQNKTNFCFSNIQTLQNQLHESQQEECVSKNNSSQKYKQQNQFKKIINAFKGYVKKLKTCEFIGLSHEQFINLKKQLFRYMKLNSFYYSVLKYIINHKLFKLMLIDFFESESQIWINSSKLQDKHDAMNRIEQLKQCVQHPELLQIYLGQQTNKIQKQKN